MRKSIVFIFLAAVALSVMFALSGCAVKRAIKYSDLKSYSVGNAEFTEKIEDIEIDWLGGSVNIVSHSGNTLLLSEKAKDGVSDDFKVHWWLDDTTLHIKFAKSGINLWKLRNGQKDLTLSVPENMSFNGIAIRCASAKVSTSDLLAETLSISTASGDANINCAANKIKLKSVSGNITLAHKNQAHEIEMESASGEINADLNNADEVDIESVSGKININADSIEDFSAESTSGNIFCKLNVTPRESEISATSGKVTLILPENPDFTAKISTVSGDFESDFALKKKGEIFVCGNGMGEIEIETASGDIFIGKN